MSESKNLNVDASQDNSSKTVVLGYIDLAIPDGSKAQDTSKISKDHVQDTLDWLWTYCLTGLEDRDNKVDQDIISSGSAEPNDELGHGTPTLTSVAIYIYSGDLTGRKVALKRPLVDEKGSEFDKTLQRALCREALVWKQLRNEHILEFIGINTEVFISTMCLVLPWMENGNVREYIKTVRERDKPSGPEYVTLINKWLWQVALGLTYLHENFIVHGDINGENILIDENGNVRLTHPGLSIINEETPRKYASKHQVAYQYRAPELFEPEEFNLSSPKQTAESDIYAFACTCIEVRASSCLSLVKIVDADIALLKVYTESLPFSDMPMYPLAKSVVSGKRPKRPKTTDGETMSEPIWHITQRCWSQQPSERPPAKEVATDMGNIVEGKEVTSRRRRKSMMILDPLKVPQAFDRLKNSVNRAVAKLGDEASPSTSSR
ncbi:hypothetical protein EUX98_g5007 [Antrodiella citrinella]|uniref:Protein kinase domain-containing protein n=1 Tax=Antrodiella citrinella TaxID=2447956 RepID=A0A4S4MVD9_9APHY|nr:hypothetical protein EUX98_g5007 [Antrodiella citrinella]